MKKTLDFSAFSKTFFLSPNEVLNPLECFSMFIAGDISNVVVENRYMHSMQQTDKSISVKKEELEQYTCASFTIQHICYISQMKSNTPGWLEL